MSGIYLVRERVWWRADLAEYCKRVRDRVRPRGMLTIEEGEAEFGWSKSAIFYWIQHGKLTGARKTAHINRTGRPSPIWLIPRRSLEQITKGVDRQLGNRVYEYGGEKWYPAREAMGISGAAWFTLWKFRNKECPEWGNIKVQARKMHLRLYRNPHGLEAWVFRGKDLDAVRRHLEGWKDDPAPSAPQSPAKKNGRPAIGADDRKFRYRMVAEFQREKAERGTTRQQFIKGKRDIDGSILGFADLKAIIQWVAENPPVKHI